MCRVNHETKAYFALGILRLRHTSPFLHKSTSSSLSSCCNTSILMPSNTNSITHHISMLTSPINQYPHIWLSIRGNSSRIPTALSCIASIISCQLCISNILACIRFPETPKHVNSNPEVNPTKTEFYSIMLAYHHILT